MTRRAEVIAIGSELLGPSRVDSNGSFLARRLGAQGIALAFRTIVGDDPADLRAAVSTALGRADVVIATGGLGPTVDDLTREAVSEALGLPLIEDAALVRGLEERFARHGLSMPPANRRQAMVPAGASVIPNRHGTAPGLLIRTDAGRLLALLPGVPVEMERMVEETLLGAIGASEEVFATRVFKVSGLTESETDRRLQPAHAAAGGVEWTILAAPGQVEIHLRERVPPGARAAGIERLDAAIAAALGDHLFGRDDQTLEGVVAAALAGRGESVAAAESVTGGGVARLLTSIPGASRWFLGGVVAYTDAAKRALLGVDAAMLATHGAVSEPVARAMAEGIRTRLGATWGVATTGYAGPEGGGPDLPPGTVHVAVAGPHLAEHRTWRVPGPRGVVQERSVRSAIDLLRRSLMRAAA
ncbi:MAG TPA: competence/damage-inducible protein A [Dongiaceae bacterium]|nr:competence/damage-inducible protein A [Dongiaceae bacterium]